MAPYGEINQNIPPKNLLIALGRQLKTRSKLKKNLRLPKINAKMAKPKLSIYPEGDKIQ